MTTRGRPLDRNTGVNDDRARPYESKTGRFRSEDPLRIGAGDVNYYRYTGNSPTNATDPSGLEGVGHHWIPQSVFRELADLLKVEAYVVFEKGTKPTGGLYTHRNDPWNDVTHGQYNGAVRDLLTEYQRQLGRKLNDKDAMAFLDFIKNGKTDNRILTKLSKTLKCQIQTINKWRVGFLASLGLAQEYREAAKRLNKTLTDNDLKDMLYRTLNPKTHGQRQLSTNAAAVFNDVQSKFAKMVRAAKSSTPLIAGLARKGAQVAGALGFLAVLNSAAQGAQGQGGGAVSQTTGLIGAVQNVTRDAVMGDVIEAGLQEMAESTLLILGGLTPRSHQQNAAAHGVDGLPMFGSE